MSVATRSNEKHLAGFFVTKFEIMLAGPTFNMLNFTVACGVIGSRDNNVRIVSIGLINNDVGRTKWLKVKGGN